MTRQSIMIWAALLITLGLSWNIYQQEPSQETSKPVVVPARLFSQQLAPTQIANAVSDPPLKLSERQSIQSQVDLFALPKQMIQAATSKQSKQPVNAVPIVAPALPFRYLGRVQAGDSNGVLLNINNEVTPIQTGDVLLGQYLVQAITETEAGVQVRFLYQPLNQVQTLTALAAN